jgi:hypothetical protein
MQKKMKLAVFYVFLMVSMCTRAVAQSPFDLKLGFNSRTYPIGAQLLATGGYNLRLWGDTNTWKYGYVRTAANLATSAVVNRAGAEVQFFPISILGFSAGYDWGVRNITMKFLDCNVYECNGRIDRKYLRANALAAYHGVIFSFVAKYENLRAPIAQKLFFDEVTLLVGQSSGENTLTLNPALLYTLNESYKVGATSLYSRAIDTGGYTHLYGPIVNYTPHWGERFGEWNVVAGVGLNRSPVVHSGFTGFLVMSYALQPSLAISERSIR